MRPAQQSLVGFAGNGRWVIVRGYRGDPGGEALRIWDLETPSALPTVITVGGVEALSDLLTSTSELLLYSSGTPEARIIDLRQGLAIRRMSVPEVDWPSGSIRRARPYSIQFTPDQGRLLFRQFDADANANAFGLGEAVAIADRTTGTPRFIVDNAVAPTLSADGRKLVVRQRAQHRGMRRLDGWALWDVETGRKENFFPNPARAPGSARLLQQTQTVLTNTTAAPGSYSQGGPLTLLDAVSGEPLATWQDETVPVIARDESLFATRVRSPIGPDNIPQQWTYVVHDAGTGAERGCFAVPGAMQDICATSDPLRPFVAESVASSDGEAWGRRTSGRNWAVRLTAVPSGESLGVVTTRQPSIMNVALSNDGKRFAVLEEDAGGRHQLLVYNVPLATPWMLLTAAGLSAGVAILLLAALARARWEFP